MADRSVAVTDTLETLRTTYNSTAGDVGDISSLLDATGTIASSTDIVEAVVAMNTEIAALKAGTSIFETKIVFEGATDDAHETTLQVTDPTADRTITLPNLTGTVSLITATETLTNKTLTSPTINTPTIATPSVSAPTITGVVTATGAVFAGASPLVFEGATANAFETTFAITDPTADRTVTIQDASGTVAYLTDITGGGASEFSTVVVNTSVIFEGSTDDGNETTLVTTDPTADRTITLPNATGTIVLKDTTDTLTNKSIDSDNNTITNIVNADIKSSAAIAFSKMADLTASRALVSDGNGDVSVSAVTSTEIGYLDGVTSAIQTQLDTKTTPGFAIAQAVALG